MIDPTSLDWQKSIDNLLPAVVQDARSGTVLMVGYMNQEALEKTIDSGNVTFYSRSKGRLWMKGEESGNTLEFKDAAADCDNDAILIKAIPSGPTCHTGTESCFATGADLPLDMLSELIEVIRDRKERGDSSSYTKQLLDAGVEAYGAKVEEEAEEVVRAAREEGHERTVSEAADLLYHLLVLLRGEDVEIEEVMGELKKRHK